MDPVDLEVGDLSSLMAVAVAVATRAVTEMIKVVDMEEVRIILERIQVTLQAYQQPVITDMSSSKSFRAQ